MTIGVFVERALPAMKTRGGGMNLWHRTSTTRGKSSHPRHKHQLWGYRESLSSRF